MKAKYWRELFERIEALTTRLTTQHRQHMLEKLHSHTSVDFSVANVSSVLIWAIKQADKYTDSQLIALVEELTEESNVALYKRNQGTIKVGNWRYNRVIDIGPYKLDYSFILHDVGARSSRGINLLNDIVTVAITLGYDAQENFRTPMRQDSGKAELYYFTCRKTGKREVLFEARRYQNGNIHLKLNNAFLQKLNCKFGQLKGWLHSVADVVEEMDVTIEQAEEYLSVQLKLGSVSDPLLVLDLKAA